MIRDSFPLCSRDWKRSVCFMEMANCQTCMDGEHPEITVLVGSANSRLLLCDNLFIYEIFYTTGNLRSMYGANIFCFYLSQWFGLLGWCWIACFPVWIVLLFPSGESTVLLSPNYCIYLQGLLHPMFLNWVLTELFLKVSCKLLVVKTTTAGLFICSLLCIVILLFLSPGIYSTPLYQHYSVHLITWCCTLACLH